MEDEGFRIGFGGLEAARAAVIFARARRMASASMSMSSVVAEVVEVGVEGAVEGVTGEGRVGVVVEVVRAEDGREVIGSGGGDFLMRWARMR